MFYISSRGHSATSWLANQISKHDRVVCWHGTRSIPPYSLGTNELTPKKFVKGLNILEQQSDKRIYGAAHGFHGISIKNEIEKEGGKFVGIFRDPVSKISSFFHAYLWSRLSYGILPTDHKGPTNELYEKILDEKIIEKFEFLKKQNHEKKNLIYKIKDYITYRNQKIKKNKFLKKKIKPKEFEKIILSEDNSKIISELFFNICYQTFKFDYEIFKNCTLDQIILMEKMVLDKDYYTRNVWNYLIPELKDKAELNDFDNKIRIHNPNKNLTTKQKFDLFPKSLQKIIIWFFSQQDINLLNYYKKNNYFIP